MNSTIGELISPSGRGLLKMWNGKVGGGMRPFRRHLHSRFEIAYIKNGSGVYTLKDGSCRFESGDIFVFPPNVLHCITDIDSDTLEYTNIHFEPYFLDDSDICYMHSPQFVSKIAGNTKLHALFCEIEREMKESAQRRELYVKSLLNMFLVVLIRDHSFAADAKSAGGIADAVRFIDENYTKPLSLTDIANVAGLTPTYFSAQFKTVYGMTPWDYIISKRIEKAIRLLKSEHSSNILDIALACGFNNTANFNKLFRANTGMTPSALRRSKDIIIH